jgi:hypothetical protein
VLADGLAETRSPRSEVDGAGSRYHRLQRDRHLFVASVRVWG